MFSNSAAPLMTTPRSVQTSPSSETIRRMEAIGEFRSETHIL